MGHKEFRHFPEARAFARSLGLTTHAEWRNYCKSGHKPLDIPTNPYAVYGAQFKGIGDWLGTGKGLHGVRQWRPFADARAFVRSLGLRNAIEWQSYCKSDERPGDIPAGPKAAYPSRFKGMGDWLGTGKVSSKARRFRPFADARAFVHALNLTTQAAWRKYSKSGERPADIPAVPQKIYGAQYQGMTDWLGTGKGLHGAKPWRPFPEARAFVRSLGLKKTCDENISPFGGGVGV